MSLLWNMDSKSFTVDALLGKLAISRALPASSQYSGASCEIKKAAWYVTSDTQSNAKVLLKYPWHVGLHYKEIESEKWRQKCTGSLIRPDLVLTAAHCLHEYNSLTRLKLKDILITAGKNNMDFYDKEAHQQLSKLKKVVVHPLYSAKTEDLQDIAIVELTKRFLVSDYVRPVCIKQFENYKLEAFQATTVAWHLIRDQNGPNRDNNHKELLEVKLSLEDCHKTVEKTLKNVTHVPSFFTHDRICAYHPNGIGPGKGDSGAGVAVRVGNSWYINGIVSIGGDLFSAFTDINYHLNFIVAALQEINEERVQITHRRSATSCELPSQRIDCEYVVMNDTCKQKCAMRGGEKVEDGDKVKMRCKRGFTPSDYREQFACLRGKWFHDNPRCIKLCKPLKKKNVEVKCGYDFHKVNCDDYVRPGTLAYYSCDKFYTITDPYPHVGVAECLENGTWNHTLPECVSDGCGFLNKAASNATPTISNGVKARSVLEYPWHVGLHWKEVVKDNVKNKSRLKWVQTCAGSLIRPNMVLTAAHCVHDRKSGNILNPEDVLVTAGKYKRDFHDLEKFQQSSTVEKIEVSPLYERTHYHGDIAIIVLEKSFVINDYVRQVCIKFTQTFNLPRTAGSFVGWGFTEHKLSNGDSTWSFSNVLLKAELPLMDLIGCRQLVERSPDSYDIFPYLTGDKICARYVNGSGPQQGDSGGGLVAREGLRWFLVGVSSIKSGKSTIAGFTKVHAHLDFIRNVTKTTRIAGPNIGELPYHEGW